MFMEKKTKKIAPILPFKKRFEVITNMSMEMTINNIHNNPRLPAAQASGVFILFMLYLPYEQ